MIWTVQNHFGPIEGQGINDIDLSEQELLTMFTSQLNRTLKTTNIHKERRTLKNCGYAASCRVKRETNEDLMSSLNVKIRYEIKCQLSKIEEAKRETVVLRRRLAYISEQFEKEKLIFREAQVTE